MADFDVFVKHAGDHFKSLPQARLIVSSRWIKLIEAVGGQGAFFQTLFPKAVQNKAGRYKALPLLERPRRIP